VSQNLLEDLGLILCVAAATTVLFRIIRQPVVVGYLIAGMIVGPHVPIPLLADAERIHRLSQIGVILLMFALGLEFSLRKLLRLGPTAGFVTALQVGLMIWLGFVVGRALGWTELESVFTGAVLSISSTTIVARAFEERPVPGEVRDLVFSVALAEDLVAVMLLAVLAVLAAGGGLSTHMMARTAGRLGLFLIAIVGGGVIVVPPVMRRVVALGQAETTLIASIGICFAFAIVAERAGYSVALGAFLAGSLVAESGAVESIGELVVPVRDLFAAIFFVSVGMMLDPAQVQSHWLALAVLVAAVIVGKFMAVSFAALLSGNPMRVSVQAGLSLAQIGEFSFIIAGVGTRSHATREFIYTLAVAVSAITTFLTPYMIRVSGPVAEFCARHEPRALRSMRSAYETLMQSARGIRFPPGEIRWPVAMLAAGALAIISILILNEEDPLDLTTAVSRLLGTSYFRAGLLVDLGALLCCSPFGAAMFSAAGRLAAIIARRAAPGAADPAIVEVTTAVLRATLLLVVVMPMLAVVQPFLEPVEGVGVLVIGIVLMAIVLWRAARTVQSHLRRAGAPPPGAAAPAAER
jgi:CPA2 family monovalent cation:H+ antiporter-2